MDSLAPPRLGLVSASAIRIRLVADLLAAWRRTNPILGSTGGSVGFLYERARSAACRGAGAVYFPRNSRVSAGPQCFIGWTRASR